MSIQIIEERRKPKLSDQLLQGLGRLSAEASTEIPRFFGQKMMEDKLRQQEEAENKSLYQNYGIQLEGIKNQELRKLIAGEAMKDQAGQQKQRALQAQKEEETQGLSKTLDWLDENIEYTGTTAIPFTKSFTGGQLNRTAIQKREEFDTAGFWAADKIFTHFNKGTVSKDKLETIKKDLAPRADLPEAKNRARIASMRRMANLPADIPKEIFDKQLEKEIKAVKKIEKSGKKTRMLAPNGETVEMNEDLIGEAESRGWKKL